MKQFRTTGTLVKTLALAGLLAACNKDDVVTPTEPDKIDVNEKNSKLQLAYKLVEYGGDSLEYIKTGKYLGMIAKISNPLSYKTYNYDDISKPGILVITCKSYSTSNNKQSGETTYEVLNGRCYAAHTPNGDSWEYKYNAAGLLEEKKLTYNGSVYKWLFSYNYISATNNYRLNKITTVNSSGITNELTFGYSNIPNKYGLNPEHTQLDIFLPIFGKLTDMLVSNETSKPTDPAQPTTYDEFSYWFDNNGYLLLHSMIHYPFGKGNNMSKQTYYKTYKFSQNWL